MGCWNETCMVSNLPVTCGDEVAMTVITKNEDGEWYRPNSLFYISPIMFYGEYNDYGTSEECHGLGLDFTIDEFLNYKTTLDKNLTPDEIVEKIARDELKFHDVKTFKASLMGYEDSDKMSRLGFIRKDVLDRILADFSWEDTFYEKDENKSFVYETINYQYYLDCIPATIKTFKKFYEEKGVLIAALQTAGTTKGLSGSLFDMMPESDMYDKNVLVKWISAHVKESGRHPFHKSVAEKIKELAEANKDEELTEFLTEFSKYVILYRFMMETRKVFTPQPNTSQDCDTDAHRFYAQITTDIADEMRKKYDDDWDERYDPIRKVYMEQCELEF